MMPLKTFRKESRIDWGRTVPETDNLTNEELRLGAFLRIADAMEIMCKDRVKLESDIDYYRKRYREQQDEISRLEKRISTYKGHVTRLKGEVAFLKEGGNL